MLIPPSNSPFPSPFAFAASSPSSSWTSVVAPLVSVSENWLTSILFAFMLLYSKIYLIGHDWGGAVAYSYAA